MKLKKEMKLLLVTLLEDKVTILSWGITNIHISSCNLSFEVSGLKYDGLIKIYVEEKCYKIVFRDKTINCTLAEIVGILDYEIEITENYISDLIDILKNPVR